MRCIADCQATDFNIQFVKYTNVKLSDFPTVMLRDHQVMASAELFCDPSSTEAESGKEFAKMGRADDADRFFNQWNDDTQAGCRNWCHIFIFLIQESPSSEVGGPFLVDAK